MTLQANPGIQLYQGDITQLRVDAIVTAANADLRGGGGVDGAVHGAAGSQLVAASMSLAPCPAGEARITPGFELAADWVIHAVGPIFESLDRDASVLESTYRSALALAKENRISSMAFPCISTGVYGFPKREACDIAVETVIDWMKNTGVPETVTFCCYSPSDFQLYQQRLAEFGIVV